MRIQWVRFKEDKNLRFYHGKHVSYRVEFIPDKDTYDFQIIPQGKFPAALGGVSTLPHIRKVIKAIEGEK